MKTISNQSIANAAPARETPGRKRRQSFVERTLASFGRRMERAFYAEELAKKDGLLQRLDPRVKVIGLMLLLVDVALARNIFIIVGIFCVGVLLTKSFHLSGEVYLAMQSRGFRGEVNTLDDFKMRKSDWLALILFVMLALLMFWLGCRNFANSFITL